MLSDAAPASKCSAFSIESLMKDNVPSRSGEVNQPAQVVTTHITGLYNGTELPAYLGNTQELLQQQQQPLSLWGFQASSTPAPGNALPDLHMPLSALSPVLAGSTPVYVPSAPVKRTFDEMNREDEISATKRRKSTESLSSFSSTPPSSPNSDDKENALPDDASTTSRSSTPSHDSCSVGDNESDDGRRKKARTSFSSEQIHALEKRFLAQRYLAANERARLADHLRLSDQQVKTWFQNRRMKEKRKLRETEMRLGHPVEGPLAAGPVAIMPFPAPYVQPGHFMGPSHMPQAGDPRLMTTGQALPYPLSHPFSAPGSFGTGSTLPYPHPYATNALNGYLGGIGPIQCPPSYHLPPPMV